MQVGGWQFVETSLPVPQTEKHGYIQIVWMNSFFNINHIILNRNSSENVLSSCTLVTRSYENASAVFLFVPALVALASPQIWKSLFFC